MIYAFYVKPAIRRRRQPNRAAPPGRSADKPEPVVTRGPRREASVRARSSGNDYPASPEVEAQA